MSHARLKSLTTLVIVIAFLAVFTLAGCGGGGSSGGGGGISGGGGTGGGTTATVTALQMTPASPSVPAGMTQQLTVMGVMSNSTTVDMTSSVAYSSSDATIASVDAKGLAIGNKVGAATITAKDPKSGLTASVVLTVTNADLKVIMIPITDTAKPFLPAGMQEQLACVGNFTDGDDYDLTDDVLWSSTNPAVATVSNDPGSWGLVTGVSVGDAEITATFIEKGVKGMGRDVRAGFKLSVTNATLKSIQVTSSSSTLPKGNSMSFVATGIFSDKTTMDISSVVTWTSSNAAFVTISNAPGTHGLATAVAPGAVTIAATYMGISGSKPLTATAAVLVSIQVNLPAPSVACGFPQQFTAVGVYSDKTTLNITTAVTWQSSNLAVATISNAAGSNGLASTLSTGSSIITATDPATGISGTSSLTVTSAVLTSITLSPLNQSLPLGNTQQYAATGHFSNGTTQDFTTLVSWSSSDSSVASISNAAGSEGFMSSLKVGATTITALHVATGINASTPLNITNATLASIAVTPANSSIGKWTEAQFMAMGTYTDNTTQDITMSVTWSSSLPTVATIANAAGVEGLAVGILDGNTVITATDPATAISGSTNLNVKTASLASITISPTNASLAKGLTSQYSAVGVYTDASVQDLTNQVTWESMNPAVATIGNGGAMGGMIMGSDMNPKGIATALSVGMADILATHPGTGINNMTSLTVNAAVLMSIELLPRHSVLSTDTNWQFTANGLYSDGSKVDLTALVDWASSNPAAATIDNLVMKGLATPASPTSVGVTTITATDLGSGISGSTQLAVKVRIAPATIPKFVTPLPQPPLMQAVEPNYYEVKIEQIQQQMLPPGFPMTTLWAYGQANSICMFPAPTIVTFQGTPISVKFTNNLPPDHIFPIDYTVEGSEADVPENRVSIHLHGAVVKPEYDGHPLQWFTPGNAQVGSHFNSNTMVYPNIQDACTLWYHDHAMGITRLNPMAGMAGFYLLFDNVELGLNLPGDPVNDLGHLLGICLQDKSFYTDGTMYYPTDPPQIDPGFRIQPSAVPEFFGDCSVVNGVTWPYQAVDGRKYRIRLLNGSNARFYHIWLDADPSMASVPGAGPQFIHIGTEQGLLAAPLYKSDILIAPGERMDLVIDFKGFEGQTLYLHNDAAAPYNSGDPITLFPDLATLMQFRVNAAPVADPTVVPAALRPITWLDPATAVATRDLNLIELADQFGRIMPMINMDHFMAPVTEKPKLGDTEIWNWINVTMDFHPLHTHLVKFHLLERRPIMTDPMWDPTMPAPPPGTNYKADYYLAKTNGQPLPNVANYYSGPADPVDPNDPDYFGWKDTIICPASYVTKVIMRFEGFPGQYVFHCHILEHEEHDMMRNMDVQP